MKTAMRKAAMQTAMRKAAMQTAMRNAERSSGVGSTPLVSAAASSVTIEIPAMTVEPPGRPVIGVSIPFLTKTFTAACKENGVAWSEPLSVPEWKERLQSSAMLSLTNKADEVRNGHFHVPSLFGQAGFDGAFKLTRAGAVLCTC